MPGITAAMLLATPIKLICTMDSNSAAFHVKALVCVPMPAQAISYKVGERAWLDIRAQLRARQGSSFDLKQFHMEALNLGSLPLDQLKRELLGPG